MQFPDSWFEDEVRDGFYVPALMKRAWAAQLEALLEIAKVCKKHNIRWFAHFGTLLGAVRHGGFIPWDDDIDICMLREDYIRFNKIAAKELPKGYHIPQDRGDVYRLHTTVWSEHRFCVDEEYLAKYHGFPYPVPIDIFPLDYIAPDPEDEEIRKSLSIVVLNAALLIDEENKDTEESECLLKEVEELLHVTLDKNKSLKNQLFSLVEDLFSLYTSETASEVARMPRWIFDEPYIYPIEFFKNSILLPFETIKLPVPAGYDSILKIEFGDYMKYVRTGDSHDYPFYNAQKKEVLAAIGKNKLPFQYEFSKNDLKIEKAEIQNARPHKLAEDFVKSACSAHETIRKAIETNNFSIAGEYLELCQNDAIHVGTMLEQLGSKYSASVGILETYCELAYQIYKNLEEGSDINMNSICHQLNEMLLLFADKIKNDIKVRKEAVFLPYKASMWHSLEPLWREAQADPDYDTYVIPIPYYYRTIDGSFREMRYEGQQYPDYVAITDYNNYNFEDHRPDIIIIHNPYDEYNLTTSVDPFFYSENLKHFTRRLIYTPYFKLDEILPEDRKSIQNMKYYTAMPGVIHADKVIVQSEQMRMAYIDCLTDFAGKDTREIWEEKISSPRPWHVLCE